MSKLIQGPTYVDLKEVPNLTPKSITDMAKECPEGKAIRIPDGMATNGKAAGAIVGTVNRYSGRTFRLHTDGGAYYLVPVKAERIARKPAKKPIAKKKGPTNNGRIINVLPKPEYLEFLEERIARYGSVIVAKNAFSSAKGRLYAVTNLRQLGYLVEGTRATQVDTLKISGPKGAHTYQKLHKTPVWFENMKGKTPATPETPEVPAAPVESAQPQEAVVA